MTTSEDYANKTGEELVEMGVGLVARGMFRMGDKGSENNPKAAYDAGMAAINVIRELAFEFLRKTSKVKQ